MSIIKIGDSNINKENNLRNIQNCFEELYKLEDISGVIIDYNKDEEIYFVSNYANSIIKKFKEFIFLYFPNVELTRRTIIYDKIKNKNDFKYYIETIIYTSIRSCKLYDLILGNLDTDYDIRCTLELMMDKLERICNRYSIKLNENIYYKYKHSFIDRIFGKD